jgi:hypothetical protein
VSVATVVTSALLAVVLTGSAAMKLSHREPVVRSYLRVGVPEHRLNLLAGILLAGAAGLLTGIAWPPVGLAAASGVVCYFVLAAGAHIRAGDIRNIATPVAILTLAALTLTLRLATL